MNTEKISLKQEVGRVKSILHSGKRIKLHIKGSSMLPLLDEKTDAVLLMLPEHIKCGDIVLYQRCTGDVILHRVIDESWQGYTMLGDHQLNKEYGITPDQIIGVVLRVYKSHFSFSVKHPAYRLYMRLIRMRLVWRLFRRSQCSIRDRKERNERNEQR